jgi:anti-sigma regulatory factor (Ser/Thr protein kinase)
MASAGHPAPAVVAPDGSVSFVDVDPGPPLGVGGLPFEMTDIELAPGNVLAFYTDGLVGDMQDPDGMRVLEHELGRSLSAGESDLEQVSRHIVSTMLPVSQPDDAALLLVRTRELSENDTAHWDVATDESEVAGARSLVSDQLTEWGMEDFVFTGEIVASELVTNAIRYAEGPVEMRLLRDGGVLVCEVADQSNTQPRMRRARSTDEHGRGLFIVAQMARRWDSRYGQTGKTVWAEIAEPSL